MALIRRSAAIPAVSTQEQVLIERVEHAPLESPQRRLRVTSSNTAGDRAIAASRARSVVDAQLKLISEAEHEIDEAQTRLTSAWNEVEKAMKDGGITEHSNGVHYAEITENWSRQSRIIDPKKFKNHVANEVFWDSIKVSLEAAGNHLSKVELDSLSDVVPSKLLGRVLKIKKIEPKRRNKG